MKKSALTSLALAAAISLPTYAADQYLWVEAETGAEYNPIVVKSDPAASQAIYLGSWKYANYTSRSNDDGRISFEVYVPESGEYTLWARMRVPSSGIKPFDVSTGSGDVYDNNQWHSWQGVSSSGSSWNWSNSGFKTYLSAGTHNLHMIQRAGGPGVHLDKILLTNNNGYQPSGSGGAEGNVDISNPFKSNVVEKYGQLRLVGNQLSDKNNQPVQLQGISAHGLQWFPLVDNQTIPYMAEYFGVEAVRLAMYIEDYAPTDPSDFWGGYMADQTRMYARAEQAIEDAVNAGIYVLVDWHIHNTPGFFTNPARDFFAKIAKKYGHLPNIIYEIANEPTGVTWSGGIKPYGNTVISAIRQYDPDNIIIVGTPNWSQDVDQAARDPLNFNNIMYAFHYYAGTHDINTMKNKVNQALDAGIAVFVSEWGSSDVGTSFSNMSVAQQWMEFMNQKGLSWINWSLGNKDEASSILKPTTPLSGPWTDDDLTAPGKWLKPYFDRATASNNQNTSTNTNTQNTAPQPQVSLSAAVEGSSVKLNFQSSGIDLRQMEIYRDTDSDPNGRQRITSVYGGGTSFTDSNAAAGVKYWYWAKAISNNGQSYGSSSATATVSGGNTSTNTQSGSGSQTIQGEAYTHVASGAVQEVSGSLGYFDQGDRIGYGSVKLDGVSQIKMRLASGSNGRFELRVGSAQGNILATYDVQSTGSWSTFKDVTFNVSSQQSGNQELYLVGVSGHGIMNLDYMTLVGGSQQAVSSTSNTQTNTQSNTQQSSSTQQASSTPSSSGSVACSIAENHWNSGWQHNVTVKNNTGSPIDNWKVRISLGQGMAYTAGWSAKLSSTNGAVEASGLNSTSLEPGQSVSFGIQGTLSGSYTSPTCQ